MASEATPRGARPRSGTCTYCGVVGPITADHIPAKNLFEPPRPQLLTVPSCLTCNRKGGVDDEYFRQVLLPRDDVAEHPEARRVLPRELRGLARPEKARTLQAFRSSVSEVQISTPDGTYLGRRMAYQVDKFRLSRVASRVIRGLFFRETGNRLPNDYAALAFLERNLSEVADLARDAPFDAKLAHYIELLRPLPDTVIGAKVFSYRVYFFDTPHSNRTAWLLTFYDTVTFLGVTAPSDRLPNHLQKFTFP